MTSSSDRDSSSKALNPYRLLRDPLPEEQPRFGGHGFAADEAVHLRDYLRVLQKRRKLVAGIFVAFVGVAAIASFASTRLYTATAKIQIERQAPQVAPVQGLEQIDAPVYDKYDYYETQYDILASRTVAARTIKALGLDSDARFVGAPQLEGKGIVARLKNVIGSLFPAGEEEPPAAVEELGVDPGWIDQYEAMLDIEPVRNSRLVKVSFTSEVPTLSAEVANKHVEEYVNSSLDQRLETTARAKEFLEEELAKAKERVDSAEVTLNQFRKEKGIIALDGGTSDIVAARLGALNARFTDAQAERIRLEGQYRLIEKRDYESLPDVLKSMLVQQLKQEASKIEIEVAELSKTFLPSFPTMQEALARQAQAQARLRAEITKIVEGIRSGYLAAQAREAELAKQLEEQRQRALAQKDVGAEYNTLARDVETARDLYASLLQRLKDVDVAQEVKVSNVSVVDAAATPLRASYPRTLFNLFLATFAGLFFGTAAAFLVDYFDDTVKTPEDVEKRLALATLGIVPAFASPAVSYGEPGGDRHRADGASTRTSKSPTTDLVVANAPRSVVAESYRAIRTAILMSTADNAPQAMLFTSGAAAEGKTVTAVNQAVTLADSGANVLIVDADIRKPRIHSLLGLSNATGLSTYLAGQIDLEKIIQPVPLDGNALRGSLHALPSGPFPPNPAELLGSRRMRETLAILRERYDFIVIDSPPVLPVTDAVVLSGMVDGVVLVVRGQETPIDVVNKARDRLRFAGATILGVVLNDVDLASGDYDRYHRYSYSYYGDASAGS